VKSQNGGILKEVKGKVVVVTGGTKGLGRALGERFAREGAKVVLWARTRKDLDDAVRDFKARGWEAHGYSVDVSDVDKVMASAAKVKDEVGTVDVLINNAGVIHGGPFLEVSAEEHRQTMDVNFNAFMWTMKAFMPDMVKRDSGHVINVSSAAGLSYTPLMTSYCGSKAAVINFTDAVRLEMKYLGKPGVKLTIVCPAFIETGMFEGVHTPWWLPWLSPEKLADKIYNGYQRDAEMVAEPMFPKLAPMFRAVTHRRVLDKLQTQFGLSECMIDWTGREGEATKKD
jgi:all-trans-retinol dehydrogenase (NAD+)